MRVIIIAGGSFLPCVEITSEDYVICADSGYDNALKYNIHTDFAVGDMDSTQYDMTAFKNKVTYPVRKDYTDSEIAVKEAISMHPDEIVMLGFLGTRLDHTLGNVFLLRQCLYAGINAYIADSHNRVYYYKDSFIIRDKKGSTVSLIPLTPSIDGITTYGLDYTLVNESLQLGTTRGISNKIIETVAGYNSVSGEGLLIIASDDIML